MPMGSRWTTAIVIKALREAWHAGNAAARGMEARSGETEGLDPKGDSPVGVADAPRNDHAQGAVALAEECKRLASEYANLLGMMFLVRPDNQAKRHAMCEQSKAGLHAAIDRLASLAAAPPVAAGQPALGACNHDWQEFYTGARRTHFICSKCETEVASPVPSPTVASYLGALQDRPHVEVGVTRPAKAVPSPAPDEELADWRAHITFVQNAAGDEGESWSDEFVASYRPEDWMGVHRAACAFLGRKLQRGVPAPAVEGWKLVPVEPTWEMCTADWNVSMSDAHTEDGVSRCVWAAMLDASPPAPTETNRGS
jgi:hypothetical protein